MKKYITITVAIIVVIIVMILQEKRYMNTRDRMKRAESNLVASNDTIKRYKVKNNQYRSEITSFEMTTREMKTSNRDLYNSLKDVKGKLENAILLNYEFSKKIDRLGAENRKTLIDTTYRFSDTYKDSSIFISVSNTLKIDTKNKMIANQIFFDSIFVDGTMTIGTTKNTVFVQTDSNTKIDDLSHYKIPEKKRFLTMGVGTYLGVGYDPFKKDVVYSIGVGVAVIPERLNFFRRR